MSKTLVILTLLAFVLGFAIPIALNIAYQGVFLTRKGVESSNNVTSLHQARLTEQPTQITAIISTIVISPPVTQATAVEVYTPIPTPTTASSTVTVIATTTPIWEEYSHNSDRGGRLSQEIRVLI